MQSFMYTIKTPVGLHARHAGLIVKEAKLYQSAMCGGARRYLSKSSMQIPIRIGWWSM